MPPPGEKLRSVTPATEAAKNRRRLSGLNTNLDLRVTPHVVLKLVIVLLCRLFRLVDRGRY